MTGKDVTAEAAIYLLRERMREHQSRAQSAMVLTVYADATPTPADAPKAVRIVEKTIRENIAAEALYHDRAAKRFTKALKDLGYEE